MGVTEQPTTAAPTRTIRLRVLRYKRGDDEMHHEEFEVPVGPRATVLDALRWIQLNRDPSLALRHSCMHASCGTCGVRIDGREELACVARVQDHGERITVEPLANLPVLTDLVVDMEEFYARLPQPRPPTRESEALPDAEPPDDLEAYVRFEDCIECALCLSACPVAATSRHYAGPAGLVAAERLLEEPRGSDPGDLLAWADRPQGAWGCHVGLECTRVCPADACPAERIMALRRRLTRRRRDGGGS